MIAVPGYSTLLSTNISNVGGMFVILEPFEERKGDPELHGQSDRRRTAAEVRRLPGSHDWRVRRTARRWPGHHRRHQAAGPRQTGRRPPRPARGRAGDRPTKASADRASVALFSTFSVTQPQLFVEIDREKAKAQNVSLDDVNNTLQSYLGSYYVNDFTFQIATGKSTSRPTRSIACAWRTSGGWRSATPTAIACRWPP